MFRKRVAAPVWIAACVAAASLFSVDLRGAVAQTPTILQPGQRIQLTSADRASGRYEARIVSVGPDTVRMNRRGYATSDWRTEDVPVSAITSLRVAAGNKSNVGRGALIGGGIGAGLGLILGAAAAAEESTCRTETMFCFDMDFGPEVIPVAMVSVGLIGAGIGALFGALNPGTRWLEVPVQGLHIEATPQLTGVRLRIPLRI